MRLTVLSVAYPFAPVSADVVGGAEQILSALDRALVAHGHRSIVAAHQDSRTVGDLLATRVPSGLITDEVRDRVRREHQANLDRAVRQERIDLIHLHGIDFHEYALPENIPALATLHLPPSWYPQSIWTRTRVQLQCVSYSQRESCPRHDLPVVENGVFLSPPSPRHPRNFALVLGRICPEKNIHTALDAGSRAGVPVYIGGQVYPYPEHERYFRQEILPRLQNGHRFLGPLSAARKRRLLGAARCLLLPTLAPETSSLVAMEALAQGTPVVAFPSGAIPEIVRDGVTGWLVRDILEMAEAIFRAERIDAATCREQAQRRFSQERMIAEYFALYGELAAAPPAREEAAHAR